ncbi:hypothetical protein BDZ97DRAFT_1380316 [Flammula alnicola]|nr:hypothetical protein BDZ97DRAFT_1380316 [Flammula alnicola]
MDRCPPEICSEIYAFACVDGGRTGRSLSLVSKFMHETSKPYKLQSISVIGHTQIYAFADLVERTPEHLRRVKSFFISAHSRNTAMDPRALAPEYGRRTEVYTAFKRILQAIAPSVKIIHAFFVFFRPFDLLPISLPSLSELVLHGSIETTNAIVDKNVQFPSLKHLCLTSAASPNYLLEKVLPTTPSLAHLRVSTADRSEALADEWRAISAAQVSAFPGHLKKMLIHKPAQPKPEFQDLRFVYDRLMPALNLLVNFDSRVSLLSPLQLDMFCMVELQEAEAMYSASAAGIPWW